MKFPKIQISNFLAISEAELSLSDRGLVLVQGENRDDTSAISNGAGKSSIFDALCWAIYGVTARDASGDEIINDVAGKGTRVALTIDDDGTLYTIARHRKHKTGKNRVTLERHKADGTLEDLTGGTDRLTQPLIDKIIGCPLEVFAASIYAAQEKMPDLPAMTDKTLKLIVEEASGVTLLEEALTKARENLRGAKIALDDEIRRAEGVQQRIDQSERDLEISERDHSAWETRRAARMEELTKLADLEKAASLAENLANDHKRDALRYRGEFESGQKKLDAVKHQVGCPCSSCGRDLTEAEIEPAKQAIQKNQAETKRRYDASRSDYQSAAATSQKLTSERDTFKASMTDLTSSIALLNDLRDQERIWSTRNQSVTNAKASARLRVEQIAELKKETNPHEGVAERLKTRRDDLVGERTKAAKTIVDLETAVTIEEDVVKVFSPAGVRAHILDEVTPFLNQQTAIYLSSLSDGNIEAIWTTLTNDAKGEAREKFTIEVVNETGGKRFKVQSGGEKRKVRLATALALQDLVSRRASKPIELFIGDEIDDALDPAGLERLTTVLEEKARDRGSVFVISHEDLKSWIPQQIRIVKEGGKTTVVEERI